MKNKKLFLIQLVVNLFIIANLLAPAFSMADVVPYPPNITHPIPGNNPVTINELGSIVNIIADFFVIIGPVLMIIALVWAAITYMRAGGDQETTNKAKDRLKYAIIGGFVVFGVGVIINTVAAVISRSFFCNLNLLGICVF